MKGRLSRGDFKKFWSKRRSRARLGLGLEVQWTPNSSGHLRFGVFFKGRGWSSVRRSRWKRVVREWVRTSPRLCDRSVDLAIGVEFLPEDQATWKRQASAPELLSSSLDSIAGI